MTSSRSNSATATSPTNTGLSPSTSASVSCSRLPHWKCICPSPTWPRTRSRWAWAGIPYFPKRPHSRLHIELTDRWESDASGLPTRRVPQPGIDGDVSHLAFDHCFEGWKGPARIRDDKLSLRMTSSLPYLVVYTPETSPYYCVEPVSHVSNAIHMTEPGAHGLRTLDAGATLDAWMKLEVAAA